MLARRMSPITASVRRLGPQAMAVSRSDVCVTCVTGRYDPGFHPRSYMASSSLRSKASGPPMVNQCE